MTSATVAERVSIEDVLRHNKIDVEVDREFVSEHLAIARAEINYMLGSDFSITTCNYPDMYDEAVKKQCYYFMLHEMHTFYMAEFPNMDQAKGMFYLDHAAVSAKRGDLLTRINELVERLKDDIVTDLSSSGYEGVLSGKTEVIAGVMFGAAGGNPAYKKNYKNDEADNVDKK